MTTTLPLSVRLQSQLGEGYKVLGELGQGGFSIVYLVADHPRQRHLAVKVMRPEFLSAPTVLQRFRREIEFASSLEHPNILPVEFWDEKDELVFYAMPRARGKPLNKHLEQRHKLPVEEVVAILRQIAAGLDHAHSKDVIHRDIKPANLMIEPRGNVSILDFGVAKGLSKDGSTLTASGHIVGSPEYMSPEQADNRKDIDHRTDIYSWGVLGYEMLTGRTPFKGTSVQQVLYQQVTANPAGVQELRPGTPDRLAGVIDRCLVKERDGRWESIRSAAAGI